MNIFVLSENPWQCAVSHCDKHVSKMLLESCQIMSTVMHIKGLGQYAPYKATHINHPCVQWAAANYHNYSWLHSLAFGLLGQYNRRYGIRLNKVHACSPVVDILGRQQSYLWPNASQAWNTPSTFALCMPEQYRCDDPVKAYRTFYKMEKSRFAKWKYTQPPDWWDDPQYQLTQGVTL